MGAEEPADKSFRMVDLPDPEKRIKEIWDIVNNPNKTSMNVLSSKDVFVQEVDGNHIGVIKVPVRSALASRSMWTAIRCAPTAATGRATAAAPRRRIRPWGWTPP